LNSSKAFALALKELRAEKKLTQEKLAEFSGLHITFISKIEVEKREPRLTSIIKLAEGLGVSLQELMKNVENKLNNDEVTVDIELADEYSKLSTIESNYTVTLKRFTKVLSEKLEMNSSTFDVVEKIVQQSIHDGCSYQDFENLIKNLSGKNLA